MSQGGIAQALTTGTDTGVCRAKLGQGPVLWAASSEAGQSSRQEQEVMFKSRQS